jgi:multidrug resistance efflux pump
VLEILICSLLTIFPDYMIRRYVQDRRIGRDITIFSVWFELRWGIVSCLMLTITLITVIFYNHPSTSNVTAYFRTVGIIPEAGGRVAEIFAGPGAELKQGDRIFRLDSSAQEAAVETSRRKIAEVDAAMELAKSEITAAIGQMQQAQGALKQATDELATKRELNLRNADIVARRDIERLETESALRQGAVVNAAASRLAAETKISSLLPAQKASAEAALQQAQVGLDKTIIYASLAGRLEQFSLRVGDIVNPYMRPAGILVPTGAGQRSLIAGFDQISAQVLKVGMIAEASCISNPMEIIPLVVTQIQGSIAAGQIRGGDQLLDAQQVVQPGTVTVLLEPLYKGGLKGVVPGSSCVANAYSNNHDRLQSSDIGIGTRVFLHAVDAMAVVHAAMLRIQAMLMPVKLLVLSGH